MIHSLSRCGLVFLLFLLCLCSPSESRSLKLNDAVSLARGHAPQLIASQRAVEASHAGRQAVAAERYGTLSLSSTATYISKLSSLELSIPTLPTISRELGTHDTYQNDLRYTLPLWTGGRLSSGIEIAQVSESIASAQATSDTLRIIYQTHLAYFNLAAASESSRLADLTLTRVKNLQKEVHDLHAAGVADSLALIDAELAVNRANLQVEQAADVRRRAELQLQVLCGLSVNEPLQLADSLTAPTVLPDQKEFTERPELLAAERRIYLAESRVKQQRTDFLPTLNAFGGFAYGKPNLDRFGNSWNDYWTAGAQLNWSFSPGGKTSQSITRARFEQQSIRADYDRLKQQFLIEQLQAKVRLDQAATSYVTQQDRATLRATAFRLSQIQFREGTLSSTRLFDAEQLLGEAEQSAALAIVEWYAARSAYWYAIAAPELSQGL